MAQRQLSPELLRWSKTFLKVFLTYSLFGSTFYHKQKKLFSAL